MKHASLKDTIYISMGECSGMLRHCKTLSIIPISSKRRAPARRSVWCGHHQKKASANPVINEAFAVDGSANVDAVVVAGEMLNMRHVERQ